MDFLYMRLLLKHKCRSINILTSLRVKTYCIQTSRTLLLTEFNLDYSE